MNLSFKQKAILYISIIFFALIALYANTFLSKRNNLEIDAISEEVEVYK